MATPIKPTPFLEGEDSIRFNKLLEKNKDKKVSKEDRERSMAIYKAVIENQKKEE